MGDAYLNGRTSPDYHSRRGGDYDGRRAEDLTLEEGALITPRDARPKRSDRSRSPPRMVDSYRPGSRGSSIGRDDRERRDRMYERRLEDDRGRISISRPASDRYVPPERPAPIAVDRYVPGDRAGTTDRYVPQYGDRRMDRRPTNSEMERSRYGDDSLGRNHAVETVGPPRNIFEIAKEQGTYYYTFYSDICFKVGTKMHLQVIMVRLTIQVQ
ncbi:hypothetical protein HDU67_000106 [Dinochytrium kinnereticum]|nr:hypothetical protein HDU67_000106 [Dinochytrium kinnereticum]